MDECICRWYNLTQDKEEVCIFAFPDSIYRCEFHGNCEECTMNSEGNMWAEPNVPI